MICSTKLAFESAQKNYKKNFYHAMMLFDTYMVGAPLIKVKKDVKKALDILKYWEKHFDNIEYNYFINANQAKVYKLLGKDKLAEEYDMKYYENNVKSKPNQNDINSLIIRQYKASYDESKQKIKDKKLFDKMINNLDLYFDNLVDSPNLSLSFTENLAKYFIEGPQKKLYMAHILLRYYSANYFTKGLELIEKFSKDDYIKYLELLSKPGFSAFSEFANKLKLYYKFKFESPDDNVKLEYAKMLCFDEKAIVKENVYGENILKDLYEKGNKKAYDVLIDYYFYIKKISYLVSFLENHLQKHKKDGKAQVLLADLYFDDSLSNTTVYKKDKFKKALKYYEDNFELLNEEQSSLLSKIYAQGIGVEVDLEKAKAYSKSKDSSELIEQEEIKLFDKIKVKSIHVQPLIDDLKLGFKTLDQDKLDRLFSILMNHKMVYEDKELLDKLALFMDKHSMDSSSYALICCFAKSFNEIMTKETYFNKIKEYMNRNNKFAYFSMYLYYQKDEEKELRLEYLKKSSDANYPKANSTLANIYYQNSIEKDDKKLAYQIFKELYESKNYEYANIYEILYLTGEYDEYSEEKYYEILTTLAYNTCDPLTLERLYQYNIKHNKASEQENMKLLIIAAENDSEFAIDKLISLYENTNIKECYKYVLKGYKNNYLHSSLRLAGYYYYGEEKINVKQDYKKAFEIFKIYEEKSNYAKFMLGRIYLWGLSVKIDYEKAFHYFKSSYENGNKKSTTYLGLCYLKGYGTKKSDELALKYYEEGSKLGGYYLYKYGYLYLEGLGDLVSVDYEKAISIFKKAAKDYDFEDIYLDMGYCYYQLLNFKEAERCYLKCIKLNKNSKLAHYNLGVLYSSSKNVDRDYKKAIEYYKMAIDLGDINSNLSLARIYIFEQYGYKDHQLARPYLQKAYENKIENAATILAYSYYHFDKDEKKAYEIIKDVKDDDSLRYVILGNLYYSGKFLNRDYNEAFINYQKAYEMNKEDPYNYFRLGKCYYFGHGVERDVNRAYDLISLARSVGFKDAEIFMEEYFNNR